jgi:hypothetical protein
VSVEGEHLVSSANGARVRCGSFCTPSVAELQEAAQALEKPLARPLDVTCCGSSAQGRRLTVCEVVADVKELHKDPDNNGALFQVASQFNALEMMGPSVTPEQGVTQYEHGVLLSALLP